MAADKLCETCRELLGDAQYVITPVGEVPAGLYTALIIVILGFFVWLMFGGLIFNGIKNKFH